jgi:homoserine dehydrogenase
VRPLNIGIAGLGTVGAGTVRLLQDNAALITARAGRPIRIAAVSARDRARERGLNLSGIVWAHDPQDMIANCDVIVELIGGAEGPARDLVEAALAAGTPVVTANKALLALHGATLAAHGTPLAFEAAVAGGIPAIKTLREGLAANQVTRIAGILNGTCNYILTTMREEGRDFAAVLADAQALGYAEADPAFDIDGVDAAHKLAILAVLAFGHPVDFAAIPVEGIRRVSALDIAFATELGYRIKLLGLAACTPAGVQLRVHPAMVPAASLLAGVEARCRRGADGQRRGGRSDRSGARAPSADLGAGGADAGACRAAGRACRRVFSAPDGHRPARRAGGRDIGAARPWYLAGLHAAAWPQAGGGRADRAGDA